MRRAIRQFLPQPSPISGRERLRAAIGALLGILFTGFAGSFVPNAGEVLPALIAPMGASAVLLFAVPSSPLAQPWSIIGGNILAAFVGVTVALVIGHPLVACAVAIGLAIPAMMLLRCLHPPSGAIALSAVLGGPAIHDLGYGFVLWPVLGNSLALLSLALVFNNLTGRPYPHAIKLAAPGHGTSDPAPTRRIGFRPEDLDAVLKTYDQIIDIERDDLETILRQTEMRSYRRRAVDLRCEAVMSRDVIAVSPGSTLEDTHRLMRAHHIKALPVTNERSEVVGIVTQTDLLDNPIRSHDRPEVGFFNRLRSLFQKTSGPDGTVKDIMTTPVRTVGPETLMAEAILIFAEEGLHHLPVVRQDENLIGILSQSDVLVAMLEDRNDHARPK